MTFSKIQIKNKNKKGKIYHHKPRDGLTFLTKSILEYPGITISSENGNYNNTWSVIQAILTTL